MRVKYAGHEEVITAGEVYYLAPGHLPVMEEDCEIVEFSPKDENRKMLGVASRNMALKYPGGPINHCQGRRTPVGSNQSGT
jgi:hypothetical protein